MIRNTGNDWANHAFDTGRDIALEESLFWAHALYLAGERTDGCTFAPDFGIKRFCHMHDFLWRYLPMSPRKCDKLFRESILTKGPRYFIVAWLYWIAVRATYLYRSR